MPSLGPAIVSDKTPVIRVQDLRKRFDTLEVLKGVSFELYKSEILVIIGPSGSGKSTLIRCMNMLEVPTSGVLQFQGRRVVNRFRARGEELGTGELRRRVGMVFQQFNLFSHRTALENVTEGPRIVLGQDADKARARGLELLDRVGLADKCDAYPSHLSGGQKQRVAIARALAMDPEVLLLDEVTSALDPELVGEVLAVIRQLARDGMTMVLVTHEMGFARDIATRVFFMEDGQIQESGSPEALLDHPPSDRLRAFLSRHLR